MPQLIVQYLVLGLSYLGLAVGRLPGLRMNRATIALVGSALLLALGAISLEEAWHSIDAVTIVFLLSMMVVNVHLAYSGFFQLALVSVLRLTRSPLGLMVVLTFSSGILSAVFLNDTLAIVFTPLTLSLTQALGLNPIPYLLALAGATNLGSMATLSGNPQNILIGSMSKIAYLDFAVVLAPVALISLAVQVGLLSLLYPEVRSLKPCASCAVMPVRLYRPLLVKTLVVTAGLLIAFVVGAPLAEAALLAAAVLLVTRRLKPERALGAIEWNVLLLFSGLFILTECTQSLNLLGIFSAWTAHPLGVLAAAVGLSNLVSNVPAVLLLAPLIPTDDTRSWLLLAAGSTLAGNLTLFGSIANLIVAEAALKLGHRLSFWQHLQFGLPLTLVTLALTYGWLMAIGAPASGLPDTAADTAIGWDWAGRCGN
ncbi:MAG: anion transporter [Leptolyngbyaceae cyanobacterium SL_7_1]|nr:anion transporter [Leptolyngbyaceae cyanobacterium SL_7_1]